MAPGNRERLPVSQRGVSAVTQPVLETRRALPALSDETVDPDLELIDRWRAGDAEAFSQLVRRHERRVFGLLMRMLGNREEAQDAAQDTFLNLHRHGHRFRRESRFSTFLYRVAVNAALNRRRSLGRRRAHMEALVTRQTAGDSRPQEPRGPEEATAGEQLRRRIHGEILQLPPALRAPVILYDLEGLSYGEIAGVLEVAEGTVKSRIHRARKALRERLADLVTAEGIA